MASEWKYEVLGDFVNYQKGFAFKSKDYEEKGHPIARVSNFTDRSIDVSSCNRIHPDKIAIYDNYKLKPDDVVIATVGSWPTNPASVVGKAIKVPKEGNDALLNQNAVKLVAKDGLDQIFLFHLLKNQDYQNYIVSTAQGSANQASITLNAIFRYEFKLPPLPEQKAIAHILGSLDDKIELNRQMNQTLEQMAQALFKSWVVDFDPVMDKALAAGNPIPDGLKAKAEQRQALGDKRKALPKDIASLFPDAFEFNEELDKWVPEGWKVEPVDKVIQINPRVTLKKETVAPFVDMKALPTSGYAISDVITKEYKGGAKFECDDVLLARITPCLENGKAGIVDFLDEGEVGFGSTEFIVLRKSGAIRTPFIGCLIRDDRFREHAIQSMVGSSGRQRVQNACFSNYYLALPEDAVLKKFDELTSPNFKTITQNKKEIITLTKLRDTLLPKLISGEVRVKDIESLIE